VRVNLSFTIPEHELSEPVMEQRVAEFMLRFPSVKGVQISYTTDFGTPVKITDIVNEGAADERDRL
jgi:hypothetical protein